MTDISKIYQEEGVPNIDSLKYWEQVVPVIGEVVDNGPEAKTRAFHVAKTNNIDQVFKFKAAIGSALADGKTFKDFVEDENIAKVAEECEISAWHLSTIYRTNMQSAYAAGRYAEMQRSKKSRPYWRYVAIHDGRTRPEHAALDKVVYPADDPFWDVNYPPNGFNCRCAVVSMTEKEVEKAGLTVSHTELGENEEVAPINPAFGNNPGKNWMSGLECNCVTAADRDVPADLQNISEKYVRNYSSKDLWPIDPAIAKLPDQDQQKWYAEKFLNEFGITDLNGHKIIILPGVNYPVVISKQLVTDRGGFNKNGTPKPEKLKANKRSRGKYLKILADSIKNPHEIHAGLLKNGHTGIIITSVYSVDKGQKQACFSAFSLNELPKNLPANFNPDKVFSGTTTFVPDDPDYIKDNTTSTPTEKKARVWREK